MVVVFPAVFKTDKIAGDTSMDVTKLESTTSSHSSLRSVSPKHIPEYAVEYMLKNAFYNHSLKTTFPVSLTLSTTPFLTRVGERSFSL